MASSDGEGVELSPSVTNGSIFFSCDGEDASFPSPSLPELVVEGVGGTGG
jgi:hypothetical protein